MTRSPPEWKPKRKARVFASKDAFLSWLLGILQAGFYPRSLTFTRAADQRRTFAAGEGAPETIPAEVVERATQRRGRPRGRKKARETRAEQVRRLARERQARYRERRRAQKGTTP